MVFDSNVIVQFGHKNLIRKFKSFAQAMVELKVPSFKTADTALFLQYFLPKTWRIQWECFLNLIVQSVQVFKKKLQLLNQIIIERVNKKLIQLNKKLTKRMIAVLNWWNCNEKNPAGIYLLKVNKNTRTRCGICSKSTIKTP